MIKLCPENSDYIPTRDIHYSSALCRRKFFECPIIPLHKNRLSFVGAFSSGLSKIVVIQGMILTAFAIALSSAWVPSTRNNLKIVTQQTYYKLRKCQNKNLALFPQLRTHVGGFDSHTTGSLLLATTGDESSSEAKSYHTLPRLYVGGGKAESPLIAMNQGVHVHLSTDQIHYLTKVLRYRLHVADNKNLSKNLVRIFNGRDGEWLAQISSGTSIVTFQPTYDTNKRNKKTKRGTSGSKGEEHFDAVCVMQLRNQSDCVTSSPILDRGSDKNNISSNSTSYAPWVYFSPIKKPRLKFLIEKCTELGASGFTPIITDRTNKKSDAFSNDPRGGEGFLEKLNLHALEAAEQSERLTVPHVTISTHFINVDGAHGAAHHDHGVGKMKSCLDLEGLLNLWKSSLCARNCNEASFLLVCRERKPGTIPVLQALDETNNNIFAFLIGPEGGWSPQEEKLFDNHEEFPFIKSISLGKGVLRSETAGIAAIASWSISTINS